MKFLADENVERSVVELLRVLDHEVLYITEACHGCSDEKVLDLAKSEGRILITNDVDFGEMTFRQRQISSGIILMRFASELAGKKAEALEHLLKYHSEKLQGHFTVISEHRIKIRPLS